MAAIWTTTAAVATGAAILLSGCGGGAATSGAESAPAATTETAGDPPAADAGDPTPATPAAEASAGFKVAHWNVQSGFGKAGWSGSADFTPGSNCATNAWGGGRGPLARTLVAKVQEDPDVVALTLNESWTCATPSRIRSLLGFAGVTPEAGGVAIVARHGLAGSPEVKALPKCSSGAEPRYVVRAPVYTDAARRGVVQVFATHWTGCAAEGLATAEILERHPGARVLSGDLNVKDAGAAAVRALTDRGYRDAWAVLRGASGGATATWNNSYGSPSGNLYKRIDYALFKDLTTGAIARLNADGEPGVAKMADHAGLVVHYAPSSSEP